MNDINNQAMIEDVDEYNDDFREEDVNEGKDEGEVEDEGEDASTVEATKIPKLKAKDALKKSPDGLPTMNTDSSKRLERFARTRLKPSFKQTAAVITQECRAKGMMLETDLTGLGGGLSRERQKCSCASLMVVWRHIRDSSFCLITSDTADFQRVEASLQYERMTHMHVKFNEGGDGDELILSPTYVPILRDRVEGQVQEGGGPARGTPTTSEAMKVFYIEQGIKASAIPRFLELYENGTEALLSPLEWNTTTMEKSMQGTCYNYLKDYIYLKLSLFNDTVGNATDRRKAASAKHSEYKTNNSNCTLLQYCRILKSSP